MNEPGPQASSRRRRRLVDSGRSRLLALMKSRWFELGAWMLVSIAVALLLIVISAQVLPPNY